MTKIEDNQVNMNSLIRQVVVVYWLMGACTGALLILTIL